MGKAKAETPWTWKQIAALKGPQLAAFYMAYGDRGRVARRVAQDRPPYAVWRSCPIALDKGPCSVISPRWLGSDEERDLPCVDRAPLVYARMIAEYGRLPE